jgi:2-polyprenyl-3-methyl-5-hydroxy-6-metoxy-1,4-benzoquinol methylase
MPTQLLYRDKETAYFSGERRDIIDRLPPDPERAILEIGCGQGATGAYAKTQGKCRRYVGVELAPDAALVATDRIDQVFVVDVETFDPPFAEGEFDVLIASEVLEHLIDPWRLLRAWRRFLRPAGRVYASSPNVANKATVAMLLAGRWDLESEGVMDRSHLRWFTPATFAAMFEDAGYEVLALTPVSPPTAKTRLFNALTGGRFAHLFIRQMLVEARVASPVEPAFP